MHYLVILQCLDQIIINTRDRCDQLTYSYFLLLDAEISLARKRIFKIKQKIYHKVYK